MLRDRLFSVVLLGLTILGLQASAGCSAQPLRVRGSEVETRAVQFEVAWSTATPPDARVLDELCARAKRNVCPGVQVTWKLGERIPARELWDESSQEACCKEHRRLSGTGIYFLHWSSGRFADPAGGNTIRMAHSWGGDSIALYADVVAQLDDVRPSSLLLHEWGHCLGLVGTGLEEPEEACAPGGHCPDETCIMNARPLAQKRFCQQCLDALERAPTRGLTGQLLGSQ